MRCGGGERVFCTVEVSSDEIGGPEDLHLEITDVSEVIKGLLQPLWTHTRNTHTHNTHAAMV